MKKNWYAVYTRPKCEKKVISSLTKKRIEAYCPLNRVLKNGSFDRMKLVAEPLFPSFVFLKISAEETGFALQCSNDIINFLYWLGRPVVIQDIEINTIKDFVASHNNIKLEKTPVSSNNKMVRIVNRIPDLDRDEKVIHLHTTETKITLPSLGYNICATSNQELEIFESLDLKLGQLVTQ